MKGKLTFLAGGFAGYVVGTRAGRGQYERIKHAASDLWHNPTVRHKASQAQDYAREKAPDVQERVTEAASKTAGAAKGTFEAAKDKVGGGAHGHASTPSSAAADPASPAADPVAGMGDPAAAPHDLSAGYPAADRATGPDALVAEAEPRD